MKRNVFKSIISLLIALMLVIPAALTCIYAEEEPDEAAEAAVFPESFDLRDVDGECYVTPVRSQAPFGTCWSFATVAAIESSILGAGLNGADGKPATPETLDLSEKQLAWFSAMPLRDEKNSQNGEGQFIADFVTEDGLINFMNRGGNACFSTNALAQGIGPEHESTAGILEYRGKANMIDYEWIITGNDDGLREYSYSIIDDWTIPDEYRYYRSYDLREARFLPEPFYKNEEGLYEYNEEATVAIKNELLNKRAVQISFMADTNMPGQDSSAMFISENWAHYTYVMYPSNHCVTIIGWDDNYPKENFLQGETDVMMNDGSIVSVSKAPPADGAWLVKNSWGDGTLEFPNKGAGTWGIEDENGVHTGYFWLSYYDHSMDSPVSYVIDEKDEDINIVDQYDYLPVPQALYYTSDEKVSMANMFSTKHNVVLEQVSSFTPVANVTVTYDIYIIDAYANDPKQGVRVATKTVKYETGGYHKEDISDFDILFDTSGEGTDELNLVMYQDYSVVITEVNEDGKYLMNYQAAEHADSGLTSFKGVINEGESWIYHDEEWQDLIYAEEFMDEVFEQLFPDSPYVKDTLTFDNFPIKAYCRQLDEDFAPQVSGSTYMYYKTEASGETTMKLSIHAVRGTLPEIPEESVVWGLLEEDNDVVEFKSLSNPMRGRFIAKNTDDAKTFAYVTVKGFGTIPFTLHVNKFVIKDIFLPEDENFDQIYIYTYTGEEIRPAKGVDTPAEVEEGVDFEYEYTDNVECGVATIQVKVIGDRPSQASWGKVRFAIVPQKSEIESITPGEGQLTVRFKDQSECGLDGYTVEYRAEGEEEWQQIDVGASETECVITGLDADKTYEVQVKGRVDVPEDTDFWYHDLTCYGEASDIATASPEPVPGSNGQQDTDTATPDESEKAPAQDTDVPAETSTRSNEQEESSPVEGLNPWIIAGIAGGVLLLIIIVLVIILASQKKKKK